MLISPFRSCCRQSYVAYLRKTGRGGVWGVRGGREGQAYDEMNHPDVVIITNNHKKNYDSLCDCLSVVVRTYEVFDFALMFSKDIGPWVIVITSVTVHLT